MPANLVTSLDDSGECHAGDLSFEQALFIFTADVFHGLGVKHDLLVGEDLRHVDSKDGFLDSKQA